MAGYQMANGPLARQKKIGQQALGVQTAAPGQAPATSAPAPTKTLSASTSTAAPAQTTAKAAAPRPAAATAPASAPSTAAPGWNSGGGGATGGFGFGGVQQVPWGTGTVGGGGSFNLGGTDAISPRTAGSDPLHPPNPDSSTKSTMNMDPFLQEWIDQWREQKENLKTPLELDPVQNRRDIAQATVPIANTYARGYSRGAVQAAQKGTGPEGADLNARRNNELQKGEMAAAADTITDKNLQRVWDANRERDRMLNADVMGGLEGLSAPLEAYFKSRALDQGDFSNLLSYQTATNAANNQNADIEQWLAMNGIAMGPTGLNPQDVAGTAPVGSGGGYYSPIGAGGGTAKFRRV